ncbi:MAG: CARDB domain-containing protein [Thermoguttaceae bacterium]|jgi:uncharacterized repeat protein (TIGR01451 family)
MLVRKAFTVVVLLEVLSIASAANAQGTSSGSGSKSIGERLDDFGQMIFGGLLPKNKDKAENRDNKENAQNSKPAPRPIPGKYFSNQVSNDNPDPQAGTTIKPLNTNQQQTAGDSSSRPIRVYRTDDNASSPSKQTVDNRPGHRYFENPTVKDNVDAPENTQSLPSGPSKQSLVVAPNKNSEGSAELSDQGSLISRPLHEQFSQFRKSAFDNPAKGVSLDNSANKVSVSTSQGTSITSGNSSPLGSSSAKEGASAQRDSQAAEVESASSFTESTQAIKGKTAGANATGKPTLAKRPAAMASSDHPMVAERTSPTTRMDGAVVAEEPSASKPIAAKDAGKIFTAGETPAASENGVLFARKGAVLSVETHGPRKITVGKESAYEVKIINSGDVAAEDLVVFVNLPEWAEVVGTEASAGSTQNGPSSQISAPLQWKVGRLEARSQEKMSLRIVPRQSRPFDLAVRWESKPATSQTMIEVQEPKLEMQLDGPREVFYGKRETYRLKMTNSGTGNAEGVTVKFVPVGAGDNVQATYELGLLPAGEDKLIEVELTARQSGKLEIQVEAKGDAGIHAELTEKVLVRRAGLEIGVEGPKLQFVGTTATYVVRLGNPGNAPAKNINFTATLPAGLKYVGGIEGARSESNGNKLHWTAESVNPESIQTFAIKCVPNTAGMSRVEVAASAEDDLMASAFALTQVESAANLALEVKDPGGPVPVGEDTVYEIRVRNRGTKDAEGVEVIAYFSRGIEPISADGGANRIGPGQVVFTPIPALAPGAETVLKIRARADTPGNHIFRAEMHCKALGSRLVSEEATLYYQDALAIPQNLQARPPLDRNIR